MQIEVSGSPVEVLDKIEAFFALDFPHEGKIKRGDSYVAMKAPKRDDVIGRLSRRSWFIVHLLLTIVTFGLWGIVVWLPLGMYKRHKHPHVRAEVRPLEKGVGITTSGTYTWQAGLDSWLSRTYAPHDA